MTIYIIDDDPDKIPEMLDDKSLERIIRDIGQVLLGVHWDIGCDICGPGKAHLMPCNDKRNKGHIEWSKWARECKANYGYLVDLGMSSYTENVFRFDINKYNAKYRDIIRWCYDNVPDLPYAFNDGQIHTGLSNYRNPNNPSEFPLVMPKNYIKWTMICGVEDSPLEIESYRNYYQAKLQCKKHDACIYANKKYCLQKKPSWTRRSIPDFLKLE